MHRLKIGIIGAFIISGLLAATAPADIVFTAIDMTRLVPGGEPPTGALPEISRPSS